MNFVESVSKILALISSQTLVKKTIVICVLLLVHIYLTCVFKDFTWLSSFGGFVTVFGVIILFNYTLPYEESLDVPPVFPVKINSFGYTSIPINGESVELIKEDEGNRLIKKYNKELRLYLDALSKKRERVITSFLLTISGTLVWAYIGYLNLYFYPVI